MNGPMCARSKYLLISPILVLQIDYTVVDIPALNYFYFTLGHEKFLCKTKRRRVATIKFAIAVRIKKYVQDIFAVVQSRKFPAERIVANCGVIFLPVVRQNNVFSDGRNRLVSLDFPREAAEQPAIFRREIYRNRRIRHDAIRKSRTNFSQRYRKI